MLCFTSFAYITHSSTTDTALFQVMAMRPKRQSEEGFPEHECMYKGLSFQVIKLSIQSFEGGSAFCLQSHLVP